MWSVGTLLQGNKQQQSLEEDKVGRILNKLRFEQIFEIVWEKYFPGCRELFANLNLHSGQVEGGTIFDFDMDMPYLVLLKVDFQDMKAEDILMSEELKVYELEDKDLPLSQWCDKWEINFRDRVEDYYIRSWDIFKKWYWDLEEELEPTERKNGNLNLPRLQRIIEVVKEDIVFNKIEKKNISYYKSVCTHYISNKGVVVETILLHFEYDTLTCRYYKKEKELYLMEDGSFCVFLIFSECSNGNTDLEIPDLNLDERVLAKNQNINQFDMDEIVGHIIWEMRSDKEVG